MNCGLLQLEHTVARPRVFNPSYGYRSGVSETMREELADVARALGEEIAITSDDAVLDIGCNDGTLLRAIPVSGMRVGIDPSVTERPIGVDVFYSDFFGSGTKIPRVKGITSIAMFYSVDDPNSFVAGIRDTLLSGGVWINQMNDQWALVHKKTYDIIGHEHICIWSVGAFEKLLRWYGLELYQVERRDINGGSVRLFIGHRGEHKIGASVRNALRAEEQMPMQTVGDNMVHHSESLKKLLVGLKDDGKTVHLYGASTRVGTILQAAKIDSSLVEYAADRSEHKWGMYMPGTDIPILSESSSRAMKPNYYLLGVSFVDQAKERERAFLTRGGKFISPYGTPRILD